MIQYQARPVDEQQCIIFKRKIWEKASKIVRRQSLLFHSFSHFCKIFPYSATYLQSLWFLKDKLLVSLRSPFERKI